MAFPSTGQLTEFRRPAVTTIDGGQWYESPLSEDGDWTASHPDQPPMLKRGASSDPVGTPGAASVTGEFVVNYSHWTRNLAFGDAEVWACTSGGQLGAALETWRVALWTQTGGNLTGYLLYYGGGIGKGFGLRKYGNNSFLGIGGANGGYPQRIGLKIVQETQDIQMWAMYSDVWTLMGTQDHAIEPTISLPGPYYMGIGMEEQGGTLELGIDCFGGGTPHRSQFFRWLYN